MTTIDLSTNSYVAGLEAALRVIRSNIGCASLVKNPVGIRIRNAADAALSARPEAPDTRVVTVAQLARWAASADEHVMIQEIRAIIGSTEK